ncbi:DNA recombination protein RmuC [Bartonella sp. HY406]|uniref:DNA recombination protein RmuC n=1 Tax=Bartonella sp. HY406 TaxID=2979331 RepID=UPI0021C67747|nr:DNA recombination protein RmuC [Bartonella sp. HY406]UXN02485.1 DNA recombination protein RmuC [Bartonella sp. HY406]
MPISNFSSSELAMFGLGSVLIGVIIIAIIVSRLNLRQKLSIEIEADERARHNDYHINALLQAQAEIQGRMQTMAELFGTRQAELNHEIGERLDGLSQHLGQSIGQQTRTTHENLVRLQERLAVIDRAQNNIQSLAGQVVELQSILSNKQTRGAFGQGRMEAIISDALPPTSYKFQATLSNGTRPDCVIYLPNAAPHLVIDAKFPLEAWNAMREATTDDLRQRAEQRFRTDMDVHIRDISQKYLISGETQDTAFMFVPSESIFATIHENFESIVEKANRARVIIVSPSLLLLAIDVVQQVLKDARMREQAHLIQAEVWALMQDLNRLDERVRKLQSHFQMAEKDVDDILISSSKLLRRGSRIEALELGEIKHNKTPDDGLPSDSLL